MQTLTVGELIESLRQYDEDLPVVSCVNYGDRSRTMQAVPTSELNEAYITSSSYSESGFAVVEDGDQDEDSESVLVLNYDFL